MVWTIPFVGLGHLSWLFSLLNSCTPPAKFMGSRVRNRQSRNLTLCRHCLAIMKMLLYYQHGFDHKSKAQDHTGCYDENWLHPDKYRIVPVRLETAVEGNWKQQGTETGTAWTRRLFNIQNELSSAYLSWMT